MCSNFSVREANDEDVPALVKLIVQIFAQYEMEQLIGNVDTPESIQASIERHRRAYREYRNETGRSCAVKCVHTDPESGNETLVACGEWYIYPKPRSPEKAHKPNYLLTAEWLKGEQGEKARKMYSSVNEARNRWLSGRGHATFLFLATDEAWRRQGAATAIVKWGLEKCAEFGIPAWLEASPQGRPVYEKLGFELAEEVDMDVWGEIHKEPALIWWPPGTREEDKKPLSA